MRTVEWVLGTLLLTAGVVGSIPSDTPIVLNADRSPSGSLTFDYFQLEGNATVLARDAAVRSEGALYTDLNASSLMLTLYEFTFASTRPQEPLRFGEVEFGVTDTKVYEYENPQITLDVADDGVLQMWPGSDSPDNIFALNLSTESAQIGGSATSARLGARGQDIEHLVQPPVVAISNSDTRMEKGNLVRVNASHVEINNLDVRGDMIFTLEEGRIKIGHDHGVDEFTLNGADVVSQGLYGTRAGRTTLAILHANNTQAQLPLMDTTAVVLTHNPSWAINGTVEFPAGHGILRSSSAPDKEFEKANLVANGTMALTLALEGSSVPYGTIGPVTVNGVGALSEDTIVRGELQTEDSAVTLNGEPYPPMVETPVDAIDDVGFLARILGVIVLAWAVIKNVALFVLGLVAKNPFKNLRRRQIYNTIGAQGMAHVRDLHRTTDIPLGSIVYHLNILERAARVRSVRCAGYRVFFINTDDFTRDDVEALALLADAGRRSICTVLVAEQQASQQLLQSKSGLSRTTVSKHVRILEQAGLLERSGRRNIRYWPTGLLCRWYRSISSIEPVKGSGQNASKSQAGSTPS